MEIIRIGSRYPVLLPQRITPEFCAMLEKYHPIWLNTHFNHPKEITSEAAEACDRLLGHGIPVQNQTVLLKGINNDLETMGAVHRTEDAIVAVKCDRTLSDGAIVAVKCDRAIIDLANVCVSSLRCYELSEDRAIAAIERDCDRLEEGVRSASESSTRESDRQMNLI